MSSVVVRYKTKPGRGDENQALVEAVFAELSASDAGGVRYATFRLDDGVTFVHVASVQTEDGTNPLQGIDAFKAFTANIGERCDEPPAAQDATVVGSYRVFSD